MKNANLTAHRTNQRIETLLKERDGAGSAYSEEELELIRSYSGAGGMAAHGATGAGLLQEFYTPVALTMKMALLAKAHVQGSVKAIQEPSCGVGHFVAAAARVFPGARVTAHELNPISARITELLYPGTTVHRGEYECQYINPRTRRPYSDQEVAQLPQFDLVLGNPPFGAYKGRCMGMGEGKWAPTLDSYFLARALDRLRQGGLVCFVMPSSFLMNASKLTEVKRRIAQSGVLLDAYRLWNGALYHTQELTDVLLLRKDATARGKSFDLLHNDGWFKQYPGKIIGTYVGISTSPRHRGRPLYQGHIGLLSKIAPELPLYHYYRNDANKELASLRS